MTAIIITAVCLLASAGAIGILAFARDNIGELQEE